MSVYVSIGNSDDKLCQADWSGFVHQVREILRRHAEIIHGEWYSASDAGYQNACFCADFRDNDQAELVRMQLAETRGAYGQESIAWAAATTDFL